MDPSDIAKPRFEASGFIYLALVAGAAACIHWALGHGYSPTAVVFGITGAGAAAIAGLERVLPYRREWMRSHGDVGTDALHLFVTNGLAVGGRWFSALVFSALGAKESTFAGSLWPVGWPLWAQFALALTMEELGGYWIHRAQHQIPWLWRFHAVHHSAPRLYWLNQMRNHPVDAVISGWAIVPVALLGAPDRLLGLYAAVTAVHLMLQHSNIDIRLGPFNWLVSMSQAHRWHHSRRIEEANANYGGVLLIWDWLFRTRVFPMDHAPPVDTGLADHPEFPQRYLGQLAAPFRAELWRSIRSQS